MYHPFFHVGVLVHDLEAASETFSRRLGITFEDARIGRLESGDVPRYRYSIEGPPFIELVEISGDGMFASETEGLHHLGFSTRDILGRCTMFDAPVQPMFRGADAEPLVVYTDPADLHGVRMEYVDWTVAKSRLPEDFLNPSAGA